MVQTHLSCVSATRGLSVPQGDILNNLLRSLKVLVSIRCFCSVPRHWCQCLTWISSEQVEKSCPVCFLCPWPPLALCPDALPGAGPSRSSQQSWSLASGVAAVPSLAPLSALTASGCCPSFCCFFPRSLPALLCREVWALSPASVVVFSTAGYLGCRMWGQNPKQS